MYPKVLTAILAAGRALTINADTVNWSELIPKTYFSLTAAALLGCIIGAVIPKRYRSQTHNFVNATHVEVHLKEIIQSCLNNFIVRAEKQDVKITTRIADNLPAVKVNPNQIRYAINGLISNALEFTPGKGEIVVTAGPHGKGGIQFTVKDNGIGMSKHKVRRIIEAPPELVISAWEQVGEGVNADLTIHPPYLPERSKYAKIPQP